ncbi:DUF6042 family protein [Kibdelosporangium phytohabitans]|uniref:Uncharacterized protein n=1 Tax=Kibdelosporangium phytohabitans TaxID=860235 RepID=A0A0N9I0I6_9PSEU|nr:DUF6042 family protein [Kibdelosporangium phytohabitans]ALG11096.1 hypothetical protein AOZ06_33200 [Kibdelosporangium phytohabitans]MBE1462339.1 hypothetical protein [Kibdelosporangium phytohabitans]
MTLLRSYEDDEYLPEYSTIVLRDLHDRDEWPPGDPALLEGASNASPCGTFVRAGHGWLQASASDERQTLRLEYHDSAPPPGGDWDDLAETPYQSPAGVLGTTSMTGSMMDPDLSLGGPGPHRVRVARRGRAWCLQFWPSPVTEPPRWSKRSRPAVSGPVGGWTTILGFHGWELPYVVSVSHDDGATSDQITEWAVAHHRPADWLDEPLADEAWFTLFATQLGVTGQLTRRKLLDMLATVGVLTYDGRYHTVRPQPLAKDVLELPAELVSQLDSQSDHSQYGRFAADLVSVAGWLSGRPASLAWLAERALTTEQEVRRTLEFAVTQQMLDVSGESDLTMTVLPSRRTYSGTTNA